MTYDPDSPAGQEYALPIDQARGVGAGTTTSGTDTGASSSAPGTALFGAGVSAAARQPSNGGEPRVKAGSAGGKSQATDSRRARRQVARARLAVGPQAALGPPSAGPGPLTVGGIVGLGAAIGALAIGFLLRRRGAR